MKKLYVLIALAAVLPIGGTALAQDFPGWPTGASCNRGDDSCRFFEADARGKVSGIWGTLPPDVRSQCTSETVAVEKSYRLLYDCLAQKMQELVRQGARQRGASAEGPVKPVNLTPAAKAPEPPAAAFAPGAATATETTGSTSPAPAAQPDQPPPAASFAPGAPASTTTPATPQNQ